MVSGCCVAFCKSYCRKTNRFLDDKGNVISFHEIPSEMGMREKWLSIISRKDFIPTDSSKVCSLHFSDDDYVPDTKYRRLKKGVVPTILPGYPSYKVPKIKEPRRTIKKHPIRDKSNKISRTPSNCKFDQKSMRTVEKHPICNESNQISCAPSNCKFDEKSNNSCVEIKNKENMKHSIQEKHCKQNIIKCVEIEEGTSIDGTPLFDIVCVKNKYVPPLTVNACPTGKNETYVEPVSLDLNNKSISSRSIDCSDIVNKNELNEKSKTCLSEIYEGNEAEYHNFIDTYNSEKFSECNSKTSDVNFCSERTYSKPTQTIFSGDRKLKKSLNEKEMYRIKSCQFSKDLNGLQDEFYACKKKENSTDNSVYYKALSKILSDASTAAGNTEAHTLLQQIKNYGKLH